MTVDVKDFVVIFFSDLVGALVSTTPLPFP